MENRVAAHIAERDRLSLSVDRHPSAITSRTREMFLRGAQIF
jgi:hypothetical protein